MLYLHKVTPKDTVHTCSQNLQNRLSRRYTFLPSARSTFSVGLRTFAMGPLAHTTTSRRPSNFPRPSASILLLSPQNHILLLHRVTTSRSFPSAHVFPGGNLLPSDGEIPAPGDPARHLDNRAYRVGAIRECFEESGILLARERDSGGMLWVDTGERERGRREVDSGIVGMEEWVQGRQGRVDVGAAISSSPRRIPTNLKDQKISSPSPAG